MQHLFGPEGMAALVATMQRRPLLAFDFDGTLAPIVARPGDARLSVAVSSRLGTLAQRLPVAIVTGRSVGDVRGRLGFEPHYIVGNHGAEWSPVGADAGEGSPVGAPAAEGSTVGMAAAGGPGEAAAPPTGEQALSRLRERLAGDAADLAAVGVTVEDKRHSLALHYRLSRTRERALALISRLLADHDPELRIFGGKMVVNVAPREAPDKADAVHALLLRSGAPCAVFAGDDVNDEPVFATAPADWLTIRVGRDDPRSAAAWCLDSPVEVALLLERMLALLGPG